MPQNWCRFAPGRLGLPMVIALALIATLIVSGWTLHAASGPLAGVRTTSTAIRQLIDDAAWESPTFHSIIQTIAASDGIVYVEDGLCQHGVHACLLLDVTSAAGYRILHIMLDRQGVLAHRKRLDLMATIGHELWHAVELLAQPTVTTSAAALLFYQREATTLEPSFETAAAVAAARKVRRELGNHITLVYQMVSLDESDWPAGPK
jgi:hypothetical protein